MMARRLLIVMVLLGTADAAKAGERDQRVFELRTYYALDGKLDELHARFRNTTRKLFEKHGMTSIGYWVPIDNPESKLIVLLAFPSRQAHEASWNAYVEDPDWRPIRVNTGSNPQLIANFDSVLLGATDYSPAVKPLPSGEHVFELRTYTATPGNLDKLHSRFRDHTVSLFEKHGMTNVGYWCPLEGQGVVTYQEGRPPERQRTAGETLIYILAHKSVDAAKASFDAFRQDPAWLAARKTSEEQAGGPLTTKDGVRSEFLKATDYSPLR